MNCAPGAITEKIEPEIALVLQDFGYELVLLELKGARGGQTLTVYIDKPGGVTSENCAEMAQKLSLLLETVEPDQRSYKLIVSSPGIERPLTHERDFARYAGEKVALYIQEPSGTRSTATGTLRGLTESRVVVAIDGEAIEVPLANIVKAHLVHEWAEE